MTSKLERLGLESRCPWHVAWTKFSAGTCESAGREIIELLVGLGTRHDWAGELDATSFYVSG